MTTMTTDSTLTGWDAIREAERTGRTLSKYTDPTEEAREGLSVEEATAIAREDPSLIYLPSQDGRRWRYRVVKRMRGRQGEWFDFGTAATFAAEADARQYAETFARQQGASRVMGARITVRDRRGDGTVATYYSDDYVAGRSRVLNPDGSTQLRWKQD